MKCHNWNQRNVLLGVPNERKAVGEPRDSCIVQSFRFRDLDKGRFSKNLRNAAEEIMEMI